MFPMRSRYHQRLKSDEQRFWEKVQKADGCWKWLAMTDKDGYARITYNGRNGSAHRVSWELHFGEIPEGMCVLHKCDNPPCVNPDHLFLGTNADNMADRDSKGRHVPCKGIKHGHAKLTEEQVRLIRYWWLLGNMTQGRIARFFGVSQSRISYIVNNKHWRHI